MEIIKKKFQWAFFLVKLRSYYWEDGKWNIRLTIPALSLNRGVVAFAIQAFGFRYFSKNNTVVKSPPTRFNVNANRLQHVWERQTFYGQWMWLLQVVADRKSLFCLAIKTDVAPTEQ
ncbi:hypothetical protein ABMA27_008642 [Loxostege sticticalis]|uniref:Uncharacterized protein n=1 Tax=Loxostege sticticalis TaxID=481309 RepID=A0ABR3HC45_LOXSC